ncbi:MAG: DNA polymerase I [Actinomycetaceae bacterium]|nr:DNA polymerase I [Actinomycetaceae bacterium]
MDKKLLLIDGHSIAFRSFYALRAENFRTAGGVYTNAVYGFSSTLLKLVTEHHPTHIAVAFDLPGGTFRTREYSEYKGGRAATPEEFKGQIELIQSMLDALGITWLTKEDYEADDIVATLATQAQGERIPVLIASGDKDSFQLVNDNCTVLYPMPRSEMLTLDRAGVEKKTGVSPERYSDLAALVGEKADNLPGVPGVGPKTAIKWLAEYGDLDGVLAHADDITGKVGEALRENIDGVKRNRELNQLVCDLDLVNSLDDLHLAGVNPRELHELCDTLEIGALRTRLLEAFPAREGSEHSVPVADFSLDDLEICETGLANWLAEHPAPLYGLALTGSTTPTQGYVDSFAIADGAGAVFSAAHCDLSPDDDSALRTWLADATIAKVAHGTKGIRHALDGAGEYELAGELKDTLLAAYLLHPDQRNYDIEGLCLRYLAYDLSELTDQGMIPGLEAEGEVKPIAARAAVLPALFESLERALKTQGEDGTLLNLEIDVSRILFGMEKLGIGVDEGYLDELHSRFEEQVDEAVRCAHEAIGKEVNLSSPKQLSAVLFDELDLPKTRKTKSGYTTNADALEELLGKIAYREDAKAIQGQEFLASVLKHRDVIKLLQSVEGLTRAIRSDGRIHTTYQQAVAATGRLSSTEPNLQNIHARTEEGIHIREAFIAQSPYVELMTADYSQIEMRLMASFSGDEELIAAFNEGADLHTYVASRVFSIPESDVTPAQRSKIKAMSYGLAYGLSAFGLSRQLKIDVGEAQGLMGDYFSRFGKVRDYLESLVEQARKDGYTQTFLGRRRYLPDLTSTNRPVREAAERMALNAPIQGSAADIIKIAMLSVDNDLRESGLTSRMLLQVHDELIFEVAPGEREELEALVRRAMGSADQGTLAVPLVVGVGFGENWRAAAH